VSVDISLHGDAVTFVENCCSKIVF